MRPQVKVFAAAAITLSLLILVFHLSAPLHKPHARVLPENQPLTAPGGVETPDSQASPQNVTAPALTPTPAPVPVPPPEPVIPAGAVPVPSPHVPSPQAIPARPVDPDLPLPADPIDAVLDDPAIDDAHKAARLRALLPTFGPGQFLEAVQHIANLSSDEDYQATAGLVLQTDLPPEAYDVLMADISDRPPQIQLPLLLDIARTPNHPERDEAREDLAFLLEQDLGNDWTGWEQSVAAHLHQL